MGPEQTRLIDRLCNDPERRLLHFNIFPGERAHLCTSEELCAEINSALDQVENGTAVGSSHPVELGVEPIDVREFVRNLSKR
jgi:hypothetical protein